MVEPKTTPQSTSLSWIQERCTCMDGWIVRLHDLDSIIILFFIHLDAFRVEVVEESTHGTVFINWTQFGKTRSRTFQECFEASNDTFWR